MMRLLLTALGRTTVTHGQLVRKLSTSAPHKSEQGTAIVECTLLAPIIVMLILGVIDFGRVFYEAISLANAVRAGVHYGARSPAISLTAVEQATYGDLQNIANVTVTAACEQPVGASLDCSSAAPNQSLYLRVTAQKTFETLFPYPGIPSSVNLSKEALMRVQ